MNSEINQTKPLNNGRTSRRKFLMRGGIILGGTTIALAFAKNPGRRALAHFLETGDQFSFLTSKKLSFWFEVDDENTIILKSAKAEMGQGIFTGFALIAAEELNISPDKIKVVSHNTKTDVNDILGTNASSSTLVMFDPIRKVAALFRETFTHTAARYWGCSPTAIVNEDAHIQWQNKKLSFAQLLDLIDDWKIPRQPKLKPKSEYKYIGQEVNRFDLAEKVMGTAKYAIDHHIEGMLYAQFISCPYIDGTIVSIDKEDCLGIKDVLDVVWEEDLIAVVAKTRHAALLGKRKLNIEYTIDRDWQQRDIEMIVSSPDVKGRIIQKKGKMSVFSRASDNFIKASYFTPIGVHSQIEPNGLVADVKKDSAEIFIGYQWTYLISHQLSKALGIKRKNISIQNHFIGGGFGRKFFMAKAVHTAKLSQRLGRPICSFWEREDEFQHGYFRPNSAHNLSAALNPDGTIHSFSHSAAIADMVFHNLPFPLLEKLLGSDMLGSGHGIRTLYHAQNIKAVHYDVKVPYKVGIWRGVGMFPNNFAQESFIDELAHEAGIDPATFD